MGGAMLAKPEGEWGMPPEMESSLTGYGPDAEKNLAEAQAIMQKLGCSDAMPLQIKIQTRNLPTYRDPAVILCDQLKKIYISERTRHSGYAALVRAGWRRGLHDRPERAPASASTIPTAASSRTIPASRTQLDPVLQRRGRRAAGRAVEAKLDKEKRQENGLGHRAAAGRGRRAADHPAFIGRQLLAAAT